jgi:hypothetical protein
MDFIEANPDKPWDWEFISSKSFTKEYENELHRLTRDKVIQCRYTSRRNNGLGM